MLGTVLRKAFGLRDGAAQPPTSNSTLPKPPGGSVGVLFSCEPISPSVLEGIRAIAVWGNSDEHTEGLPEQGSVWRSYLESLRNSKVRAISYHDNARVTLWAGRPCSGYAIDDKIQLDSQLANPLFLGPCPTRPG